MGRELVGETANLAAAHRVWLPGQRQRPWCSGSADPAGREMAVDDRVDLIGAGGRLVHALRKKRDGPVSRGEPIIKSAKIGRGQIGDGRDRVERGGHLSGSVDRSGKAGGEAARSTRYSPRTPLSARCTSSPANSATSVPGRSAKCKSAISHVAVRRGSITTTLVPRASRAAARALIQHRMAPGHVAADEHDEIGGLDVIVAARDDVLAKGADMTGDRRGHAQPRIGVDIRAADEALHQLVGDVIILGQELAGNVERDRVGPMGGDGVGRTCRRSGRAPRPSPPRARGFADAASGLPRRASRRAQRPSNTGGRGLPGAPRRRRSFRPRTPQARSRPRNKGRWS